MSLEKKKENLGSDFYGNGFSLVFFKQNNFLFHPFFLPFFYLLENNKKKRRKTPSPFMILIQHSFPQSHGLK